jgi:putative flippase GtrA
VVVLRYALASALALGVDMGLFLLLIEAGAPPSVSAGASYAAGMLVHWWLSSRTVFLGGLAEAGADRARQQVGFILSGLLGLALSMGIVGAGSTLEFDPRSAKLAAVAVSFWVTYLLRRHMIFVGAR